MKIPDTSELGVSEIQWAGWCRDAFDRLNDGGVWIYPDAGLIFQRKGDDTLMLIERAPHGGHVPTMKMQDDEFDSVRRHFKAAGIKVIDQT